MRVCNRILLVDKMPLIHAICRKPPSLPGSMDKDQARAVQTRGVSKVQKQRVCLSAPQQSMDNFGQWVNQYRHPLEKILQGV